MCGRNVSNAIPSPLHIRTFCVSRSLQIKIWRVYDLGLQGKFTVNLGWKVPSIFGFINIVIVIFIVVYSSTKLVFVQQISEHKVDQNEKIFFGQVQ